MSQCDQKEIEKKEEKRKENTVVMDSATAAASICLGNNKKISVCMYDDDLS